MKVLPFALLLAACGAAPDESRAPTEPASILQLDQITVANGHGRYTGRIGEQRATVDFSLPLDRVDPERGHGTDRVGATDNNVVVLTDRYATRTADADKNGCAVEGREAWVRVFALGGARQLAAIPIESCLDDVSAADVTWEAPNRFRITTRPARVYTINDETLTASSMGGE